MKPDNWNELDTIDKLEMARILAKSMRGNVIIGQALAIAVKALRQVDSPFREVSNIEDMEMLGETLFQPWYSMTVEDKL